VATHSHGAPQVEIRIGRVASRLTAATADLDDLARRLLSDELPEQHAAHREGVLTALQGELQTARNAEDELRLRAEELRDQQLAMQTQPAAAPSEVAESPRSVAQTDSPQYREADVSRSQGTEPNPSNDQLRGRLDSLRLELASLLASFTDEHPQVLALQRQIDSLLHEMDAPGSEHSAGPELSPDTPTRSTSYGNLRGSNFVSISPVAREEESNDLATVGRELKSINYELALATKRRADSEQKLHQALASLSLNSPTTAWSSEPARLVARLGGTPRMLPLLLAILAGMAATIMMFRATRVLGLPQMLNTTSDLAAALPIPLVGQSLAGGNSVRPGTRLLVTPARVRLVTKAAETVLLTILGVCLVVICLDQTLVGQFASDPFGVLSEIVGRVLGR